MEARNRSKAKNSVPDPTDEPVEPKDFEFKEFSDLSSLPKPEWLVYKFLRTLGSSYLTGPTGQGKTFGAVELACRVATGMPFEGRPVKQKDVLFIEGEDIEGVAQRFLAWAQYHGISDIPRLHIVPRPIHIPSDGADLIEAVQKRWPNADWGLVVIDTLAANARGVNENLKHEFDEVTVRLQNIWRTFNCHVLVLHHTGNNGKIRGTSDMPGESATHISVSMVGNTDMTLHCEKIRGVPFEDMRFTLKPVKMPYLDDEGHEVFVPVLGPFNQDPTRAVPPELQKMIDALKKLLNATPDGATYSAWAKASGYDLKNSLDKNRFNVNSKNLQERGEVKKTETGRSGLYIVPCYVPPSPPEQETFEEEPPKKAPVTCPDCGVADWRRDALGKVFCGNCADTENPPYADVSGDIPEELVSMAFGSKKAR